MKSEKGEKSRKGVERAQGESLMRISDIARSTGLTKQTVQYYLMLGLISETSRSAGGHRLFDHAAIQRIKLIHQLNQSGYSLCEIRETFLKPKKNGT